jgi:hypothetical protein
MRVALVFPNPTNVPDVHTGWPDVHDWPPPAQALGLTVAHPNLTSKTSHTKSPQASHAKHHSSRKDDERPAQVRCSVPWPPCVFPGHTHFLATNLSQQVALHNNSLSTTAPNEYVDVCARPLNANKSIFTACDICWRNVPI